MTWRSTCFDFILPDTCNLCGQSVPNREVHLLCPFCWAALPRNTLCCDTCARPMSTRGTCGRCARHQEKSGGISGRCVVPLLHEAESRHLIHQLKFQNGFRAGQTLAAAMLDTIQYAHTSGPQPERLVPVPLSWRRQVHRGYNQSAWLARCISRELKIPICYGPITRRHGPAQQFLPIHQRLELPNNTFQLRKALPFNHVAIIDDVLTTGTTTRVLAELLRKNGIEQVDVWCATRATWQ